MSSRRRISASISGGSDGRVKVVSIAEILPGAQRTTLNKSYGDPYTFGAAIAGRRIQPLAAVLSRDERVSPRPCGSSVGQGLSNHDGTRNGPRRRHDHREGIYRPKDTDQSLNR